jgi:hypothetical protein
MDAWDSTRLVTPGRRCLLGALLLCLLPTTGTAEVYKSVGPDGKVVYSDTPPATPGSTEVSKDLRAKSGGAKMDPVIAALNIYAKEIIVETSYRFCREQVPKSEESVRGARNEWLQRHQTLRTRKNAVLKDRLTTGELLELARKTEAENEAILGKMKTASVEEITKWCTDAPKTYTSREFDLAGNLDLADAILKYQVQGKPAPAR